MGDMNYYAIDVLTPKGSEENLVGIDTNLEEKIIFHLRKQFKDSSWVLDEFGNSNDGGVWKKQDEDMKAFSLMYPDYIFRISVDGSSTEDFWQRYYRNGKMQHCEGSIVYEKYNPAKLGV